MIAGIIPNNTTPNVRLFVEDAILGLICALTAPVNITAANTSMIIAITLSPLDFFNCLFFHSLYVTTMNISPFVLIAILTFDTTSLFSMN